MPRFLDTCAGDVRKQVRNHGVLTVSDEDALVAKVVELAEAFFRKVPILVITSSLEQLTRVRIMPPAPHLSTAPARVYVRIGRPRMRPPQRHRPVACSR